jgi:putative solute:sodium symporter small subunit
VRLTKILLLVVFVITLVVPFFNRTNPTLFGFPFFYWYQMAAVPVSSLLIYAVFRAEDRSETDE